VRRIELREFDELDESDNPDISLAIDVFSLIPKENTMERMIITIKKIKIGLYVILLFMYDKVLFIELIMSLPTSIL
jgi:hypothetical protein